LSAAAAAEIRQAIDAGLNPQALDLARNSLADAGNAAEIRYLGALASARMGAIDEAEKWLAGIDHESLHDSPLAVEVWSLAGRIAKDRFAAMRDRTSAAARHFARTAIVGYQRAFALAGAAYPAVNAATMAMLAGNTALAQQLAQQALATLGTLSDHWHYATSGEALLLLGRQDESRAHYAEARRLAGHRFGDIASMRRQLLLIGSGDARELAALLPAPNVIAFSGHMIDHPDRASPRFPEYLEVRVAAALRERIATLGPSLGYAQAACGADILFLEAMQDAGYQTQIVLPFPASYFVETSVRFAGDGWMARFEHVIAGATRVVVATDEAFHGDDVLFEHAANLIQGMAFLRAAELSTRPLMLTVQERDAPEAVGGTAATARAWRRKGGQVDNIDLAALRGGTSDWPRRDSSPSSPATPDTATKRSLKSLLFADISGYTRMPEQYAPRFAQMFLGTCKSILDVLDFSPVHANTHGDGLFLVFDLPSQAAEFAIRLQQAMGAFDWPTLGLSEETGARTALHTGPLFRVFDPVTDRLTFYGTHVNRAARLEPVVQPRQIFVTEEFAASLLAQDQERFTCDYIGAMPLAKRFGDARLYRLRLTKED
jgi:class 3 adenylate cyclase/tetratricopeptide (TPR) repeat protein